jgi:hypothetical protein
MADDGCCPRLHRHAPLTRVVTRGTHRPPPSGVNRENRPVPHPDLARQRAIVDAVLAAVRAGQFEALVASLGIPMLCFAPTAPPSRWER